MGMRKLQRGRWSQPGRYYAVTVVTRSRSPLFTEDSLAQLVVAELQGDVLARCTSSVAWVVMPDHVHWLFQLRTGELSPTVQALKSRSTRSINAVLSSQGSVWQAGFYDHLLRDEDDVAAQAKYIVANPLRRGLAVRLCRYPHWWCKFVQDEADL